MPFTTDKRLYLNENRSQVVEEGPDARFLFAAEGTQVSDEDATRYGLNAPKAAVAAEEPAADVDAEAKQVAAPPENKARRMRSDKDE
jgi:hypothetical protein